MHHKKIHLTVVKLTFLNKKVFLEVLLETISRRKKNKTKIFLWRSGSCVNTSCKQVEAKKLSYQRFTGTQYSNQKIAKQHEDSRTEVLLCLKS